MSESIRTYLVLDGLVGSLDAFVDVLGRLLATLSELLGRLDNKEALLTVGLNGSSLGVAESKGAAATEGG